MRAALLLALVAALAGCGAAPPPAGTTSTSTTPPTETTGTTTTTTTTPTSTTPPPTPTPTPSTTTTTTPPTPPPPRAPFHLNVTHDYSTADANASFDIPASALPVNATIFFHVAPTGSPLGGYACAGTLRVTVYAPNGTVHDDVRALPAVAQDNNVECGVVSADPAQTVTGGDIVAGTWHVLFTGPGTGVGRVQIAS